MKNSPLVSATERPRVPSPLYNIFTLLLLILGAFGYGEYDGEKRGNRNEEPRAHSLNAHRSEVPAIAPVPAKDDISRPAEVPLYNEGCEAVLDVVKVEVDGLLEIDQPYLFEGPATVWRCPSTLSEHRLIWRHNPEGQWSTMTIPAGADVVYDRAESAQTACRHAAWSYAFCEDEWTCKPILICR